MVTDEAVPADYWLTMDDRRKSEYCGYISLRGVMSNWTVVLGPRELEIVDTCIGIWNEKEQVRLAIDDGKRNDQT